MIQYMCCALGYMIDTFIQFIFESLYNAILKRKSLTFHYFRKIFSNIDSLLVFSFIPFPYCIVLHSFHLILYHCQCVPMNRPLFSLLLFSNHSPKNGISVYLTKKKTDYESNDNIFYYFHSGWIQLIYNLQIKLLVKQNRIVHTIVYSTFNMNTHVFMFWKDPSVQLSFAKS